MRHHHHSHAFPGQIQHDVQDFLNHLRIQGTCGLIEEHYLWFHGHSPGNGHALFLTSGKLSRIRVSPVAEADTFEEFLSLGL